MYNAYWGMYFILNLTSRSHPGKIRCNLFLKIFLNFFLTLKILILAYNRFFSPDFHIFCIFFVFHICFSHLFFTFFVFFLFVLKFSLILKS